MDFFIWKRNLVQICYNLCWFCLKNFIVFFVGNPLNIFERFIFKNSVEKFAKRNFCFANKNNICSFFQKFFRANRSVWPSNNNCPAIGFYLIYQFVRISRSICKNMNPHQIILILFNHFSNISI